MSLRTRAAASLATAALAVAATPTGAYAAPMSVTTDHASSAAQVRGSGHRDDYDPWGYPDCRSRVRRLIVANRLKAELFNGRRGPTAIIRSAKDNSVQTFLDVNWNPETTGSAQFKIEHFFKIHPILVVRDFDKHKRFFLFPIRHCRDFRGFRLGHHHHLRFREYPNPSSSPSASSSSPSTNRRAYRSVPYGVFGTVVAERLEERSVRRSAQESAFLTRRRVACSTTGTPSVWQLGLQRAWRKMRQRSTVATSRSRGYRGRTWALFYWFSFGRGGIGSLPRANGLPGPSRPALAPERGTALLPSRRAR